MKYSLRTEHLELSDMDRETLDHSMNHLEKHVQMPYVTDVTIAKDTHHLQGHIIRCVIVIEHGKKVYRAERSEDTVQHAIEASTKALKAELATDHDRQKDHSS